MAKPTNHYGVRINSDIPITGVISNHDIEWLHEISDGIDLDYETLLSEYESDSESFFTEYCIPEEEQEDFDIDDYMSMCDSGSSTYLLGSWRKVDGMFEPDESGEYSAICGEIYTQVVYSQYVTRATLCSPCYPGQADVPSDGIYLAYTLPPDVMGERLTKSEGAKMRYETVAHHVRKYAQVIDNWLDKKGGTIADIKRVRPEVKSILGKLDRLA